MLYSFLLVPWLALSVCNFQLHFGQYSSADYSDYHYTCSEWPSPCLVGKIQALLAATKEQRREYKAKFVDMDVEFARMRERLETMNLILDDIQVCL